MSMASPPRNLDELSDLHLSPRFDQLAAHLSLHQSPGLAPASWQSTAFASDVPPRNVGYHTSRSARNGAPQDPAGSTTMANRHLPETNDPYASPGSYPDHPDFQSTPARSRSVEQRNDIQYPEFTAAPRISRTRGRSGHRHASRSRTVPPAPPVTYSPDQTPPGTRSLWHPDCSLTIYTTDHQGQVRSIDQTIVNRVHTQDDNNSFIRSHAGHRPNHYYSFGSYSEGPHSASMWRYNSRRRSHVRNPYHTEIYSTPHPPVIPPDTPAWDSAPSGNTIMRNSSTRPLWRRLLSFVTCRP